MVDAVGEARPPDRRLKPGDRFLVWFAGGVALLVAMQVELRIWRSFDNDRLFRFVDGPPEQWLRYERARFIYRTYEVTLLASLAYFTFGTVWLLRQERPSVAIAGLVMLLAFAFVCCSCGMWPFKEAPY